MKRIISVSLLSAILFLSGCQAFDIVKDNDGKEHTKIEQTLDATAATIKDNAPAANAFFPGAGLVGTAIAGLLGLIGHGITTAVVSRKRKDALTTVVQGVEDSTDNFYDISHAVMELLKASPYLQARVEDILSTFATPKKAVLQVSTHRGNKKYLDKHVQKITHGMKRAI